MSKKHLLLSLALVSIGFSATLNAQCPVSSSSGGPLTNPSGLTMGQSFTVNCSGVIDSLELYADAIGTSGSGTLNIYPGNSVTGSLYNQAYGAINCTVGSPIRIVLTTPFAVTTGMQYTFEFFISVPFRGGFADIYAGGSPWQDGTNYPTAELDFAVYINSGVGVKESDFAKGIKLFPNPAMDVVTIDLGQNITKGTINLYTPEGQLVMTEEITGQTTSLNLTAFAKGIYFVKIVSEENTAVIRVVHE